MHRPHPTDIERSLTDRSPWRRWALALLVITLSVSACQPNDRPQSADSPQEPISDDPNIPTDPPMMDDTGTQVVKEGQDEFISASGIQGEEANDDELSAPEAAGENDASADDRTVEEGDIYRVIRAGLMVNLNTYRGLQVIDIDDTSAPRVIGRLPLSGSPIEMYMVGDYGVVLLNNWWGYWGGRDDIEVNSFNGGMVALVDLRDPTTPSIIDIGRVPGYIQTSRLTRSMAGDAVYVVANEWSEGSQTILRSFLVETPGDAAGSDAQARLIAKGEVDLGGYIRDIQATPTRLMIARNQGWSRNNSEEWNGTYVTLIDISDPTGEVVEGGSVRVDGYVRKKSDMHIQGEILRVVSSDWSDGSTVATWNIEDVQEPILVDSAEFGQGEDLFASLFMRDRAFFVTYRRVDPFHAFSIDSEGLIEERSEYIISGWNDFFRPTFDQTRLVGIGMDDQSPEGRQIAVSLYDITDLDSDEPFLDRAHGDLAGWSWSEARWDDRAFSVIEDAVEVDAEDGSVETGLVLLPFSGYDDERSQYMSGVQIFTFSETSVTARGVMDHDSPVRRSFEPEEGVVGNLSELSLSLFDRENPDQPTQLGRVDLAPDYSRLFFVGEGPSRHAVRLKGSRSMFYYYWGHNNNNLSPATLEVIAPGQDPDMGEVIASIEVPARADIKQVGDLLISIHSEAIYDEDTERHLIEGDLQLIDFSTPEAPQARGSISLDDLQLAYSYNGRWGGYYDDCWDCYGYWWGTASIKAYTTNQGIFLQQQTHNTEEIGEWEHCYFNPWNYRRTRSDEERDLPLCDGGRDIEVSSSEGEREMEAEDTPEELCELIIGNQHCSRQVGDDEFNCRGELLSCEVSSDDPWSNIDEERCEPIDVEPRSDDCYTNTRSRYWQTPTFIPVDLSDLDAPRLLEPIERPEHEMFKGVITQGETLYYSYAVPVEVNGDSVSFVRHFTRKITLSDQAADEASVGPAVNLPGRLLSIDGDRLITQDLTWGQQDAESSLNVLRLSEDGTRARLNGRHLFSNRRIKKLRLDHAGRVVVSHGMVYGYGYGYYRHDEEESMDRLAIFDDQDLTLLGESVSDRWSNLVDVTAGRAVFQVGGGVLLMDITDAEQISPQAFFPIQGWSQKLTIEGDKIYSAANRFGIYTLPLMGSNLAPAPL
jgi:hypothetical protein